MKLCNGLSGTRRAIFPNVLHTQFHSYSAHCFVVVRDVSNGDKLGSASILGGPLLLLWLPLHHISFTITSFPWGVNSLYHVVNTWFLLYYLCLLFKAFISVMNIIQYNILLKFLRYCSKCIIAVHNITKFTSVSKIKRNRRQPRHFELCFPIFTYLCWWTYFYDFLSPHENYCLILLGALKQYHSKMPYLHNNKQIHK